MSDADQYYPGIMYAPHSHHGYQCSIDGFYFAPHPYDCEKYFICENRRIHPHQCGPGINWDYVYLQCNFPDRTYCFSNSTFSPPISQPVTSAPDLTTIGVTAPVAIEHQEPTIEELTTPANIPHEEEEQVELGK